MVPKDPKYFTLPVIKTGKRRSDYCQVGTIKKLKFDIDFASLAIKAELRRNLVSNTQ
jgi:hypothetical protein